MVFPASFGIEISPADLDNLTAGSLVELLVRYKLILVRSLVLTPYQLVTHGRKFGKLYLSSSDLKGNGESIYLQSRQYPEITVLSRDGLHENAMIDWHIDLLHKPSAVLPGRFLYTHAADIASTTQWADTERAYELIDPESRAVADESFCFYAAPYPTQWVGCVRHMVLKNPITMRRSLLVDKTFTRCIIGESYEDTGYWKAKILAQVLIADNIYNHNWRKGDLIIYDNNALMHQRETMSLTSEGQRTIWRLTFDY